MKIEWPFLVLLSMLLVTALSSSGRKAFASRNLESWVLDLVGLFMHQIGLRAIGGLFVFTLFNLCFPSLRHSLSPGWGLAVALTIGINYLNYWGHRALHSQTPLWNVHQVHHTTSSEMNVLSSFRNTVWAPLFEVYFWAIPFVIFVVKDPSRYLTLEGVALVVVFWIHSGFRFTPGSRVRSFLSHFLILPENHAWHHSAMNTNCNYGSLFNLWDRMHGTWHQPGQWPEALGVRSELPLWKKLFFPFETPLA